MAAAGMAVVVLVPSLGSSWLSQGLAALALLVAGAGLSFASPIVSSSAGRYVDDAITHSPSQHLTRCISWDRSQLQIYSFRISGMLPADALSFVTSFGYCGYFIGPPLFGGLAEYFGSLRLDSGCSFFVVYYLYTHTHTHTHTHAH